MSRPDRARVEALDAYHGLLLEMHAACEEDGLSPAAELADLVRLWLGWRGFDRGKAWETDLPRERIDAQSRSAMIYAWASESGLLLTDAIE